ncbi:MAG: hypothetical protein P4M15_13575 [Alphaproteobacteria bacterium]|nr:hypothetical protein [Alphaproteobacteria bacterium]
MAIDPVSASTNIAQTQRPQASGQVNGLRNNPTLLNAIVTQQKASRSLPQTAFAAPQNAKGNGSNLKLPRGSLVDEVV